MNWITQKEGIINLYNKEIHLGTQPTRIQNHMFLHIFQNTNKGFFEELKQQIKEGKLNRELGLVLEEVPIRKDDGKLRTPRVNGESRKIEIHETFLSYLWCCTYAIYVTYIETIDYPKCNKEAGKEIYTIRPEKIEEANELFDYAKSLIVYFSEWDKDVLPNPEIYLAQDRDYVEQTNCYYSEALKFILCHEYTHLALHIDQIEKETPDSHFLEFEKEADDKAIEYIKNGLPKGSDPFSDAHRLATENGVIFGILSMFFFSAITTGKKHPNTEDRLTNALESLDLKNNEYPWGIACVGLQMWDKQFDLNLEWNSEIKSYKEQYYEIIAQIKQQS